MTKYFLVGVTTVGALLFYYLSVDYESEIVNVAQQPPTKHLPIHHIKNINEEPAEPFNEYTHKSINEDPTKYLKKNTNKNYNAKLKAQVLFEQFKINQDCFSYFSFDSEQKIIDFLLTQANENPSLTDDQLMSMRIGMQERLRDCPKVVRQKSQHEFYNESLRILEESAKLGLSEAQLNLSNNLQHMSLARNVGQDKSKELYEKSLYWLQMAANSNNPKAKIMLALEYMDPVHHPEVLDLKVARSLIKEAEKLSGEKFPMLLKQIDELD